MITLATMINEKRVQHTRTQNTTKKWIVLDRNCNIPQNYNTKGYQLKESVTLYENIYI